MSVSGFFREGNLCENICAILFLWKYVFTLHVHLFACFWLCAHEFKLVSLMLLSACFRGCIFKLVCVWFCAWVYMFVFLYACLYIRWRMFGQRCVCINYVSVKLRVFQFTYLYGLLCVRMFFFIFVYMFDCLFILTCAYTFIIF